MTEFTYYDSTVRPPDAGDCDVKGRVLAGDYDAPLELVDAHSVRCCPGIYLVWAPALPSPRRSREDIPQGIRSMADKRGVSVDPFQPRGQGRLPLAAFTDAATGGTFYLEPERLTGSGLLRAHEREQSRWERELEASERSAL